MSQVWNIPIPSSEILSTSRTNLNDALQSLQSNFLGTADPTGGALVEGLIFINTTAAKLRGRTSSATFDVGDWGVSNLGHLRKDGTIALTANWNIGGFLIQNLGAPAVGTDAARKTEVDAKLAKAGDTLNSGALLSYASPAPSLTAAENLTHKGYCDLKALKAGDTFTGRMNFTQSSNDRAINVSKTNTNPSAAVYITNASAGTGGYGLRIDQTGAALGFALVQTGADLAANIQQDTNNTALFVDKNGTGGGLALDVENEGTGPCIRGVQNGAGDGLRIVQNANNRAVQFTKPATGSGTVLEVANAGTGLWIATDANGTMNGTGARLGSNGIWTDGTCYKKEKTNIQAIDADDFLSKIKRMSISRYSRRAAVERGLKEDPTVGPFMEELVELFGLPGNGVRPSELASVALAGVKALLSRLEVLEARAAY